MSDIELEQRVRYPPFEPGRFEPGALPIATQTTTVAENVATGEVIPAMAKLPPSFCLGTEDGWLIQQRYLYQGEPYDDSNISRADTFVERGKIPRLVKLHRRGWYLTPNPIHRFVRKFMSFSVWVLLGALGYLFIEPVLSSRGIPSIGTGTIRIGLLDYPALTIVVVPLLFAPLIMRVAANISDLIHQRKFLQSAPVDPSIVINGSAVANEPLELSVKFPEKRNDWTNIEVMWRVGILPPARDEIFQSLGRAKDTQPPPGLTTSLPHHWEVGLDDGTGGGEEAPMEHHEVKGGLFLRPMRVMEFGGRSSWKEGMITLSPPPNAWPGTVSTPIVRIHWEIIIRMERPKGGSLMFVKPLIVGHPERPVSIEDLPTNDGRTESDQL